MELELSDIIGAVLGGVLGALCWRLACGRLARRRRS
jgi:hypothetical protein